MSTENKQDQNRIHNHELRRYSGNFHRFKASLLKFLKMNLRDKPTYFWVFGYPMIFILIFGIAFNTTGNVNTYNIAIINEDGIYDASLDSEFANVSQTFVELFDPEIGNRNLTESFVYRRNSSDNVPYNKSTALEDLKNDQLDAVIVIPRNFSELIIGNTWWYSMLPMMPPEEQVQLSEITGFNASDLIAADFPQGKQPSIEIHTTPDAFSQTVISGVMEGILGDIIYAYNNISALDVELFQVSQVEYSAFDVYAPGFVIVGVTVAIMMVSIQFAYEKEKDLIKRLETTPVPRWVQLLSGGAAQMIYSSLQIVILLLVLVLLGIQTSPHINWILVFLNALIVALPCTGIGLIIASFVQSEDAAGGMAWVAILPLQFLSNAFFPLSADSIVKFNPIYYGVRAMKRLMLLGVGFETVWQDMGINLLFGIIIITAGVIIFQKKTKI